MKTLEDATVPADVAADAEAVIRSLETGQPLDPEVRKRIRERADKIRERVFREHGLVDIAVPAIPRRGELPE